MGTFTAKAPARANIIGEHTDYAPNGGRVLPTPLPFHASVTLEEDEGAPGRLTIASENMLGRPTRRWLAEEKRGHWTDYVVGCLRVASTMVELPSLTVSVKSNVPIGCGISSSAALCVAVLRAARGLTGSRWTDRQVALMAFEAEHDYVGVPCGKMDQFASSLGLPGQALLLDTRTLKYRNVHLPPDIALMLVDCGKKHDLAKGDSHNKRLVRMAECSEARDRLGVGTLCELGRNDLWRLKVLPANVAKRARHVITENLRVLAFVRALERGNVEAQASIIAASNDSLRDDFQCSIPELDALVESSRRFGIRAARPVGGGFGGAIIALVPREQAVAWWSFVSRHNPNSSLISTYALKNTEDEYAA